MQRVYATAQVRNCYPSFMVQFDTLDDDAVIWEPYSADTIALRYPSGISYLCTREHQYWFTRANLVFDVFVEEMSLQRVMRQFGRRQLANIPPNVPPLPLHIHK